jgi:hypothetical protein
MTDDATPNATPNATPESPRADAKGGKSSYRASAPAVATVDNRLNGGAGVQRSHLRNRKAWLKGRTRAGQTWAQRKANSVTYCPAKAQRTS